MKTITNPHKYPSLQNSKYPALLPYLKCGEGALTISLPHGSTTTTSAMNTTRALLYSFTDRPFRPLKSLPDISCPKRPREALNFRVRLRTDQRCCIFRVSVRNSGRGETGKVYADVKSDRYEILESVPESVKLEADALDDAGLDSTVPWWEEFPKRWVIVILCFSAFLLCNMDRVRCCHSFRLFRLFHICFDFPLYVELS